MLPRHTWMACQTKYRMVKNKEGRSDGRSTIDAPAVGKQGQSNEAQVIQEGMEAGHGVEDTNETTGANSSSRSGMQAVGVDIDDHDKQNSGMQSTVAASSKTGDPEHHGGEVKEESITENKE